MGRPKDRHERELRRAQEELTKGIGRGDGERAAAALLQLPAEQREQYLGAVADVLAARVQQARLAHDQAALAELATLVAREPRLLAALSGPARAEVRWALLLRAAQRGDFDEARVHQAELHPELAEQAPVLAAWLAAWVAGHGVIAEDAPLPALPAEAAGEPRSAPRVRLPPPSRPLSLDEVEPAVLAAAATQKPPELRALLYDWVASLPPELAHATRVLAGQLALREALVGAAERRHLGPLAVLTAMAVCESPTGAPLQVRELMDEVFLGLRLASSCRTASALLTVEEARVLRALSLAVAADPRGRVLAIAILAVARFPASLRPQALSLFKQLLEAEPEPNLPLLVNAIVHLAPEPGGCEPLPNWLLAALSRLLSQPPARVTAWLAALELPRRETLLAFLAEEAPPEYGLRLGDVAWTDADASLRQALAELVVDLIETLPDAAPELTARVRTVADCLELFEQLEGGLPPTLDQVLHQLPPTMLLPADLQRSLAHALRKDRVPHRGYDDRQRAEVARFAGRLTAVSLPFVELAMGVATSDEEASQAAAEYLQHAGEASDAVPLLFRAFALRRNQTLEAITQDALRRWGHDAVAMARLLMRLRQVGAPKDVMLPFARALRLAHARYRGPVDERYGIALFLARELVPRMPRKKPPAAESAPESEPSKGKRRAGQPKKQEAGDSNLPRTRRSPRGQTASKRREPLAPPEGL